MGRMLAWRVVAGVETAYLALIAVMLLRRVPSEDEMVKQAFGPRWDVWAEKVPYKLVPFVY